MSQSDLIVVLGGDGGSRIKRGIELYAAGRAPRILVINPAEYSSQCLNTSAILPASILTETKSRNSHDEAVNTLAVMKRNNWQNAVVVSDPPHMRRLDLTWGRLFNQTGYRYKLAASRPEWWDARFWWQNSFSAKFVLSEYAKLVWYWIRY
jgi:uncharacterized SAM-binding protein YcdF (DUF218 family)